MGPPDAEDLDSEGGSVAAARARSELTATRAPSRSSRPQQRRRRPYDRRGQEPRALAGLPVLRTSTARRGLSQPPPATPRRTPTTPPPWGPSGFWPLPAAKGRVWTLRCRTESPTRLPKRRTSTAGRAPQRPRAEPTKTDFVDAASPNKFPVRRRREEAYERDERDASPTSPTGRGCWAEGHRLDRQWAGREDRPFLRRRERWVGPRALDPPTLDERR